MHHSKKRSEQRQRNEDARFPSEGQAGLSLLAAELYLVPEQLFEHPCILHRAPFTNSKLFLDKLIHYIFL